MKKYIIGIILLGVLVAYSLGIRQQQPKLAVPSSMTNSGMANATSSGAGTPPAVTSTTAQTATSYKDGSYTGTVADAYYGSVEVKATISGGKMTDVAFLQYPNTHSTSVYINRQAVPYLQQEAVQTQSAQVNIISGATYTSRAFQQSLTAALEQAR